MTDAKFREYREKFTKERFAMCDKKSVGYTEGSDNRHYNFEQIGRELDIPTGKVMMVYLMKHWMSLKHFIKTGEQSGEGVAQTIMDIQNYSDLLSAWIEADMSTPEPQAWSINTPGDVGYAEREKSGYSVPHVTANDIEAWREYKRGKGAITSDAR